MALRKRAFRPAPAHMGPVRYLPDLDRLERLRKALAYTAEGSKNFVIDLIHKHETFGGWTVNQSPYVDQMLEKAREHYRRVHAKRSETAQPRVSPEGMRGLNRMFDAAKETMRNPAVLLFNAVLKRTSDSVYQLFTPDAGLYMGKLTAEGDVVVSANHNNLLLTNALSRLGENPYRAARAYNDASGACMLCGCDLPGGTMHQLCAGRFGLMGED